MKNNKKTLFIFSVILSLFIFSAALVIADSTTATTTRVYCKYNAGAGSMICDSGAVAGDSASCSISESVNCAEEGDVYRYAESSCEYQGTTTDGPTTIYNVNWDGDQTDCDCKVGATGRYGIRFIEGISQCCGDDANEYFIDSANPKNIDAISSCCKADSYVFGGTCCGDDPGEYYAGPTTGNSCDGTKACCGVAGQYVKGGVCISACPNVTTVYITDMAGNVSPSSMDNIDYIKLAANLIGVADATPINFTISAINTLGATCYSEEYREFAVSNGAGHVWQIHDCSGSTIAKVKAKAYIAISGTDSPDTFKESAELIVNAAERNSPPHAAILSPPAGSIYLVNQVINFTSSSYDEDDPLDVYEWDFGDGRKSNLANTTLSYTTGGPKIIRLKVQDHRGLISQERTGILIDTLPNPANNDYPLAFISTPKYGQVFSGLLIDFDGSKSVDDITPFNNLEFTWTFEDGYTYRGAGLAGAKFTRLFSNAGEHTVRLSVDDGI